MQSRATRSSNILPKYVRPMPNAHNADLFWSHLEDHSEITYAKPKASLPLTGKRFDVTFARFAEAGKRTENAHRIFSFNGSRFRAGGLWPDELQRIPNSRRISS